MLGVVNKYSEEIKSEPGPASSEGEHLPTNPAIRVRFSNRQMNISLCCGRKMRNFDLFKFLSSKNQRCHLLEKGCGSYTLLLSEKGM